MTTQTLKQIIDTKEEIEGIRSYSMNLDAFSRVQTQAIADFENAYNVYKTNTSSADALSELMKKITDSIMLFVPNFCYCIEGAVNFYSALLNPISRYDFSQHISFSKDNEENRKTLEKLIFNDKKKYNSLNKLKLLISIFLNQINTCSPTYPVKKKINNTDIEIIIGEKLPLFSMENFFGLSSRYQIQFSLSHDPNTLIPLTEILQCAEMLFEVRDFIAHPQPFDIMKLGDSLSSVFNDLEQILPQDIPQDLPDLFAQMGLNQDLQISDLYNNPKLINQIQNFFITKLLNKNINLFPIEVIKFLFMFAISFENNKLKSHNELNPDGINLLLIALQSQLAFNHQNIKIILNILRNIHHKYSEYDTYIHMDKFYFLVRYLETDTIPDDISSYISKIKKHEFKNPQATLFDVLEYTFQHTTREQKENPKLGK